jgi:transposase, IS30 family
VQGRGKLRRELARCLRTGMAGRRPRGRDGRSGYVKDMVMISDRPAEAGDRAVLGHWEGDLIIGGDCKSAVGTLAGRTTRYVMLLHLPAGREAHLVEDAMREAITALPAGLARTITWDQGIEMSRHADFTIATASRSTSATRTAPGSADRTRTPTGCCASTCPRAPICRYSPPQISPGSRPASTTAPARRPDS